MLCIRSFRLLICCCTAWLLYPAASSAQSPNRFTDLLAPHLNTFGDNDASVWTAAQYQGIRQARSARELLEFFRETVAAGQLPPDRNPAAELEWVAWRPRGWRWEAMVDDDRIILAAEDGFLAAIRLTLHGNVEMSLCAANQLGETGPTAKHFTAMSERHFSRIEPEAHQLYAYLAGPSRTIVRSRAVATPAWADLARGSPGRR